MFKDAKLEKRKFPDYGKEEGTESSDKLRGSCHGDLQFYNRDLNFIN